MIRVGRVYEFSAAHFLPLVADGHKCKRVHGHNWRVELVCVAPLVNGMSIDFFEIDKAWTAVHQTLDHTALNDHPALHNPTSEVVAAWIFATLKATLPLVSVRVSEDSGSWCEYTPERPRKELAEVRR